MKKHSAVCLIIIKIKKEQDRTMNIFTEFICICCAMTQFMKQFQSANLFHPLSAVLTSLGPSCAMLKVYPAVTSSHNIGLYCQIML